MAITPGRWEIVPSYDKPDQWLEIWADKKAVVRADGFQRTKSGETETYYGVRIPNPADARAIVAIPVMVQALKRALPYVLNAPYDGALDVYEAMQWAINQVEPEEE